MCCRRRSPVDAAKAAWTLQPGQHSDVASSATSAAPAFTKTLWTPSNCQPTKAFETFTVASSVGLLEKRRGAMVTDPLAAVKM